jgi:hypothetical protein
MKKMNFGLARRAALNQEFEVRYDSVGQEALFYLLGSVKGQTIIRGYKLSLMKRSRKTLKSLELAGDMVEQPPRLV